MSRRSLLLRLWAAAAGLIAVALLIGGVGLFLIFDAALDRQTSDELNHTAKLLAGQVAFDAGRQAHDRADASRCALRDPLRWTLLAGLGRTRRRAEIALALGQGHRPAGRALH